MKSVFLLFLLTITISIVRSQPNNKVAVNFFESIPLLEEKYKVEGKISGDGYYNIYNRMPHLDLPLAGLMIEGKNKEKVIILFNNGKLYFKKLIINYEKSDLKTLERNYADMAFYYKDKETYLEDYFTDITNKSYGGKIGEGVVFIINKDPLQYQRKSVESSADIEIQDPDRSNKLTALIIGYKLLIESINLTGTGLSIKTGITTY